MASAPAPALSSTTASLDDRLLLGQVTQINPFLPKLILVMFFITAIESKLRHTWC